jgi:TPR repeat protein
MKKLLGILVLGLLWCNISFADDPNDCPGISQSAIQALMKKEYSAALKFAEESRNKENVACADFILGNLYFEGWGVEKNQIKGLNFYKQAAEKGHDIAQKFLGAAYFKGIGTDKNHALAEKWFKILAEKDNVNGQTYLGYIYAMGDGVNQNLIESYMWFYIVSKKHPEPARSEMKKIENDMSAADVASAIKKANEWLGSR